MRKALSASVPYFLISLLSLCCPWQAVHAACHEFSDVLHTGAYALADESGRMISSCRPETPFIPASLIKIPVALAALHLLGRDFRYQTAFYMDAQDNLYIRGSGDPFLISEEVELIAAELKKSGTGTIKGIYIDNSLFALEGETPGGGRSDNPYDSPVSAAGVNFNTVSIRVDEQGNVVSAEPQTPTLPLMRELGTGLKRGTYRLNICQQGCAPEEQTARYTAELFRVLLERAGISGSGPFGNRSIPAGSRLLYIHENSRNLGQIVSSLLKYSNNYTANMVFLACGVKTYGHPATWDKARRAVREVLEEVLGPETAEKLNIYEGSGLARRNSVTAAAMLRSLTAFRDYRDLLQERHGTRIKSGTLDGVYNYAGYVGDAKPFVILLNQGRNTRDAILARLKQLADRHREE